MPMTVDSYLSFPVRTSLAGVNGTIAWLEAIRGVHNVWLALAPQWSPTRLTSFAADGMEITSMQITAPASVVFVRGPIAGANTLAATDGAPTDATWVAGGAEAAPRVVTNESMVGMSPSGGFLFTRAEGTGTALVELASSQPGAAYARLFAVAKGKIGGLAWRDDELLAFSNDRGSHGFVGLYARGARTITWVAPSVDLDVQPTWALPPDDTDGHGPSGDGHAASYSLAWLRARPPPEDDGYGAFDGGEGNRGPDFTVWRARVTMQVGDAAGDAVGADHVVVRLSDATPLFDETK